MNATLIIGSPGSGKTELARDIAREQGSWNEANFSDIDSPFGLSQALSGGAKTLIIEDVPATRAAWSKLKRLCTSREWILNLKGVRPRTIPARNIIVTANQLPGDVIPMGRHFRVVRTDA